MLFAPYIDVTRIGLFIYVPRLANNEVYALNTTYLFIFPIILRKSLRNSRRLKKKCIKEAQRQWMILIKEPNPLISLFQSRVFVD